MDYDIPTELADPENLICIALDSGHAGKTVLKILDDFDFTIMPKDPTDAMLDAAIKTVIADMSALYRGERDTYRVLWRAMLQAATPTVNG